MKTYFIKTVVLLGVFFISSCDSDDSPELLAPTVASETTASNMEATYTTIEISGNVSSDGGSEITSRGVCWSTNQDPTINDNKTTETSNTFTSTIDGLVANTSYNFRVYATNSVGTSYGEVQAFSTSSLDETTWDFLIVYDPNQSSNADVTFNADGTTLYDEPSSPGTYTTNGTWSLNGNVLTYDIDTDPNNNSSYLFTGTLSNNTMSGTFTHYSGVLNWTATKY